MSNHHPPALTRTAQLPAQPADHALLALADRLAAAGLETRSPAWEDRGYLKLINTPGAVSELTITTSGHLTWEYRPHKFGCGTHARLAAIIAALLGPTACPSPPPGPSADRTLLSLAGRALASYGLKVTLDILDISQADYTAYTELRITNPARPEAGTVSLAPDGTIWWECRTQPNHGLDGIAAAIIHALTATLSPG
jgi:hypothetical protein